MQREADVFGDGVNIASRLQGLAAPDTICISHVVYREVEKKLPLGTVVALGRPKRNQDSQSLERAFTLGQRAVSLNEQDDLTRQQLRTLRKIIEEEYR